MQPTQTMTAEEMAKLFHHYRDTLAAEFGFESSGGCVTWEEILPRHRDLMVASARLVLLDLARRRNATGCGMTGDDALPVGCGVWGG